MDLPNWLTLRFVGAAHEPPSFDLTGRGIKAASQSLQYDCRNCLVGAALAPPFMRSVILQEGGASAAPTKCHRQLCPKLF